MWRALRRPNRIPLQEIKARDARLIDGRKIGHRRQSRFGHHGIALDGASTNLRGRQGRRVYQHVDLARQQILHHWRAAAVGDELIGCAGHLLEEYPGDMANPADPLRATMRPGLLDSSAIGWKSVSVS